MVIIPATISNNVPGTDLSLGADTALNVITEVSLIPLEGVDQMFMVLDSCLSGPLQVVILAGKR